MVWTIKGHIQSRGRLKEPSAVQRKAEMISRRQEPEALAVSEFWKVAASGEEDGIGEPL